MLRSIRLLSLLLFCLFLFQTGVTARRTISSPTAANTLLQWRQYLTSSAMALFSSGKSTKLSTLEAVPSPPPSQLPTRSRKPTMMPTFEPTSFPTNVSMVSEYVLSLTNVNNVAVADINNIASDSVVLNLFATQTCSSMSIQTKHCRCRSNDCVQVTADSVSGLSVKTSFRMLASSKYNVVARVQVTLSVNDFLQFDGDTFALYNAMTTAWNAAKTTRKNAITSSLASHNSQLYASISVLSQTMDGYVVSVFQPSFQPTAGPAPKLGTNAIIAIVVVLGGAVLICCLLAFCYWFNCLRTKHKPTELAKNVSVRATTQKEMLRSPRSFYSKSGNGDKPFIDAAEVSAKSVHLEDMFRDATVLDVTNAGFRSNALIRKESQFIPPSPTALSAGSRKSSMKAMKSDGTSSRERSTLSFRIDEAAEEGEDNEDKSTAEEDEESDGEPVPELDHHKFAHMMAGRHHSIQMLVTMDAQKSVRRYQSTASSFQSSAYTGFGASRSNFNMKNSDNFDGIEMRQEDEDYEDEDEDFDSSAQDINDESLARMDSKRRSFFQKYNSKSIHNLNDQNSLVRVKSMTPNKKKSMNSVELIESSPETAGVSKTPEKSQSRVNFADHAINALNEPSPNPVNELAKKISFTNNKPLANRTLSKSAMDSVAKFDKIQESRSPRREDDVPADTQNAAPKSPVKTIQAPSNPEKIKVLKKTRNMMSFSFDDHLDSSNGGRWSTHRKVRSFDQGESSEEESKDDGIDVLYHDLDLTLEENMMKLIERQYRDLKEIHPDWMDPTERMAHSEYEKHLDQHLEYNAATPGKNRLVEELRMISRDRSSKKVGSDASDSEKTPSDNGGVTPMRKFSIKQVANEELDRIRLLRQNSSRKSSVGANGSSDPDDIQDSPSRRPSTEPTSRRSSTESKPLLPESTKPVFPSFSPAPKHLQMLRQESEKIRLDANDVLSLNNDSRASFSPQPVQMASNANDLRAVKLLAQKKNAAQSDDINMNDEKIADVNPLAARSKTSSIKKIFETNNDEPSRESFAAASPMKRMSVKQPIDDKKLSPPQPVVEIVASPASAPSSTVTSSSSPKFDAEFDVPILEVPKSRSISQDGNTNSKFPGLTPLVGSGRSPPGTANDIRAKLMGRRKPGASRSVENIEVTRSTSVDEDVSFDNLYGGGSDVF